MLLIAGGRAKVTDFEMSRFINTAATRLATMTTCPGTPAFMSPEALNELPVCTEKLDKFSLGCHRLSLGSSQNQLTVSRPSHSDTYCSSKVAVPEAERRHTHINLIEPTHPLLPIALHCLKDECIERPSSQQLCGILAAQ